MVKNVMEVVKVKAYEVSVCSEEYESLNTETEMGQGILSLLSGKKHYTACQMEVTGARCTNTGGAVRHGTRWEDMFYDEVHTEEVKDQMTARVEKAVCARPGRICQSRRTS